MIFALDLCFVYVVEAFITLHWKPQYNYMSPLEMAINMYTFVFLYKILIYRGFNFIVNHARHIGSNEESTPWDN